jgi:hypothetical protein
MTSLRSRGELALPAPSRSTAAAVAGVVYVAAWVVGLAVQSSGPAVDARQSEVARHFRTHAAAAWVQSLLIHGVAGLALIVVAWALCRRAGSSGQYATGNVLRATGWAAAALSLVQMALGLIQAATASRSADHTAKRLFDSVNQLDGAKMLLLAVMVASGVALARVRVLPRWLGIEGAVLVLALVVAGVGYLALSPELGTAAELAVILLLVWVGAAGVAPRSPRTG